MEDQNQMFPNKQPEEASSSPKLSEGSPATQPAAPPTGPTDSPVPVQTVSQPSFRQPTAAPQSDSFPVSPTPAPYRYQYQYGRLNRPAVPTGSTMKTPTGAPASPMRAAAGSPVSSGKSSGKKGLRLFAIILSTIVALTAVAGTGYWVGKTSGDKDGPSHSISDAQEQFQSELGNDLDLNISSGEQSTVSSHSAVAAAVSPSVVGILTYSESNSSSSTASGVIMDRQGYIITNDHVYSDVPAAKFIIITNEGKQYDAQYVAGDTRSDLAVLKADFKDDTVTPATFSSSDSVKVGDQVLAIGNPGGMTLADTVTSGIVSATERWMSGQSGSSGTTAYSMCCIQTDAAINPGNSGGALVNMNGEVIGIPSSKIVATGYEGIGFAIPIDSALKVVRSLVKNGYVADRAKLGVTYQTIDPVTAKRQNMKQGLYISGIDDSSDLNHSGVAAGDIILQADGMDASLNNNMLRLIADKKPGDTITLKIYKSQTAQTITVTATLLMDKGSSSYTTQEVQETTQNPFFSFR